jgi:hypothetical protein
MGLMSLMFDQSFGRAKTESWKGIVFVYVTSEGNPQVKSLAEILAVHHSRQEK